MALNPFHYHSKSSDGPALGSFAITPSNTADLSTNIRAITYATLPVQRLLWEYLAQPFIGAARDILSVITDGSAAVDPVMAQVRGLLAAEYGIAMP